MELVRRERERERERRRRRRRRNSNLAREIVAEAGAALVVLRAGMVSGTSPLHVCSRLPLLSLSPSLPLFVPVAVFVCALCAFVRADLFSLSPSLFLIQTFSLSLRVLLSLIRTRIFSLDLGVIGLATSGGGAVLDSGGGLVVCACLTSRLVRPPPATPGSCDR